MKRDLFKLEEKRYDLLVIGGGIYGACVAWEAALRGLSVTLLERSDFASATSANSLKIIHGGLRYLRHGDLKRMRESIRERRTLMSLAPHLVHPLPVLVPTYGHDLRGREAMAGALIANDLIGFDRNRGVSRGERIPRGQTISRGECLRLLPGLPSEGLTGGAIFYDAQVCNSERLVLSFVRSAAKSGADVANYVEVTGLLRDSGRVIGVEATDVRARNRLQIRASVVVNAAGPWVNKIIGLGDSAQEAPRFRFVKAISLVTHPIFEKYAVGVYGTDDPDADATVDRVNRGNRFLFIAPWRGHSLVGTEYLEYNGDPDDLSVTEQEIETFLDKVNRAYPSANLKREGVTFVHLGLVPVDESDRGGVQPAKHYRIHDHAQDGLEGLISVVGVKYTTARDVAEKVVDRVREMLVRAGQPAGAKRAITGRPHALHGGECRNFEHFMAEEIAKPPYALSEGEVRRLVCNYGSAYPEVVWYYSRRSRRSRRSRGETLTERQAVLQAEVLHAVRHEMAQRLSDFVFRRTDLGSAGHPGEESLRFCADIMARELEWDAATAEQEIALVNRAFERHMAGEESNERELAGSAVQ